MAFSWRAFAKRAHLFFLSISQLQICSMAPSIFLLLNTPGLQSLELKQHALQKRARVCTGALLQSVPIYFLF